MQAWPPEKTTRWSPLQTPQADPVRSPTRTTSSGRYEPSEEWNEKW